MPPNAPLSEVTPTVLLIGRASALGMLPLTRQHGLVTRGVAWDAARLAEGSQEWYCVRESACRAGHIPRGEENPDGDGNR